MKCYLDSLVNPVGWLEWQRSNFALSTLYYAEYKNFGPASSTRYRVKWPGFHVITSANVASKFTVSSLIAGRSWLPATGVPYTAGPKTYKPINKKPIHGDKNEFISFYASPSPYYSRQPYLTYSTLASTLGAAKTPYLKPANTLDPCPKILCPDTHVRFQETCGASHNAAGTQSPKPQQVARPQVQKQD
ncbi:hypothetical protein GBA52_006368 [Prunus armeniaca]|nr:hypothetical protein GBA52_006368 [Prunus armeniaca]